MIKRNRKGRKRGPVRSNKVTYDGINFSSGLERYCYIALKKHKLFEGYENEAFQLLDSFNFEAESYERQANGKGELRNRGTKKVLGIKYTPDFCGKDFIIETKGRANESFPLRWKLFKAWKTNTGDLRPLYKPQNQKEVDRTIEIIKEKRKSDRG